EGVVVARGARPGGPPLGTLVEVAGGGTRIPCRRVGAARHGGPRHRHDREAACCGRNSLVHGASILYVAGSLAWRTVPARRHVGRKRNQLLSFFRSRYPGRPVPVR